MGDMIKFGIKLAMTIACAIALVAAIALLFSSVSSAISGLAFTSFLSDISKLLQLYLPINIYLVMSLITSLGAFKVAYWAADKMIQFIDAMG